MENYLVKSKNKNKYKFNKRFSIQFYCKKVEIIIKYVYFEKYIKDIIKKNRRIWI